MLGINDDFVFTDIEEIELQRPFPRKEVYDRMIYMSRVLKVPKDVGGPVLCDFGSAMVINDEYQREFIQPRIYRAPEVILGVPWTYSVDIWNVGCMVRQLLSNLVDICSWLMNRSGIYTKVVLYSRDTIL